MSTAEASVTPARGPGPRIAAIDPRSLLAELQHSPLVQGGSAQILGLEGVRARLGEAWPDRRDRIYARVEAQAARLLPADDLFLRIGEVDYLLIAASPSAAAAQAAALHLLRDLLIFLFGEARTAELVIRSVSAFDSDGVTARTLSPEEIRGVLGAHPQPCGAPDPPGMDLQPSSAPMLVRTPGGVELGVEHLAAPLVDLRRDVIVGASVWRRVYDERTGAELGLDEIYRQHASVIQAIDLAAMRYADRLAREADRPERSLVVAPLSLHTLGTRGGRATLATAARSAQSDLAARVIVEITGLSHGFLATRVREAAAAVRPYCRAIFAQIPPSRAAAEQLGGCGLRGASFLAVDLARAARDDHERRRLTEGAALVGPGLMICGLRSVRAVALARAAGASLAVLDPAHAQAVLDAR